MAEIEEGPSFPSNTERRRWVLGEVVGHLLVIGFKWWTTMSRLISGLKTLIPWLVYTFSMVLLVMLVIILFPSLKDDFGFRSNFLSGLISTILGALIGIPAALGINNVIQLQQDELKRHEDRELLIRVLETVHKSLIHNRQQLELEYVTLNEGKVLFQLNMDYSTWDALQFELTRKLKNPALQQRIAYHFTQVRGMAKLHDTYFGYTKGMMSALGGGDETAAQLRTHLIEITETTHKDVNEIIVLIEKQRSDLIQQTS